MRCKKLAIAQAKLSNMPTGHIGAVIAIGGKPLSFGFNSDRTYVQGECHFSLHAEHSALNKLSRSYRSTFMSGKKQPCILRGSGCFEQREFSCDVSSMHLMHAHST